MLLQKKQNFLRKMQEKLLMLYSKQSWIHLVKESEFKLSGSETLRYVLEKLEKVVIHKQAKKFKFLKLKYLHLKLVRPSVMQLRTKLHRAKRCVLTHLFLLK